MHTCATVRSHIQRIVLRTRPWRRESSHIYTGVAAVFVRLRGPGVLRLKRMESSVPAPVGKRTHTNIPYYTYTYIRTHSALTDTLTHAYIHTHKHYTGMGAPSVGRTPFAEMRANVRVSFGAKKRVVDIGRRCVGVCVCGDGAVVAAPSPPPSENQRAHDCCMCGGMEGVRLAHSVRVCEFLSLRWAQKRCTLYGCGAV